MAQIQHVHGRSYEDIISSVASDASLDDAFTQLCTELQRRFPKKNLEEGQKFARRLLQAQPEHMGKTLLQYLESIKEERPDFQDGKFELTLRNNFFQLKEDLGNMGRGFEKFAGITRKGWWAKPASDFFAMSPDMIRIQPRRRRSCIARIYSYFTLLHLKSCVSLERIMRNAPAPMSVRTFDCRHYI